MSLIDRLEQVVPRRVQQRAEQVLARSQVEIIERGDKAIGAFVFDRKSHYVGLRYVRGSFGAVCDCADFARRSEICEHIWAVLVQADSEGLLDRLLPAGPAAAPAKEGRGWRSLLRGLKPRSPEAPRPASIYNEVQLLYAIDVAETLESQSLILRVQQRERTLRGKWGKPKPLRLAPDVLAAVVTRADATVLAALAGGGDGDSWSFGAIDRAASSIRRLPMELAEIVLPLACATGRCSLLGAGDPLGTPLRWDDGAPWCFYLTLERDKEHERYTLAGELRRADERMPLAQPDLLLSAGFVFSGGVCARLDHGGSFAWIPRLRREGRIEVPAGEAEAFVGELMTFPVLPRLDLPADLRWQEERAVPRPRLRFHPDGGQRGSRLVAELSFDYDGRSAEATHPATTLPVPEERRVIFRDRGREWAAAERLFELGLGRTWRGDAFSLTARHLPQVTRALLHEGWTVEAEGKLYRSPGRFQFGVTTGIDWFDLEGGVAFDDQTATLAEVAAALAGREPYVRLGDGSFGLLPEDWLRRFAPLAALGKADGDGLRFTKSQIGVLDLLLAEEADVRADTAFAEARAAVRDFDGLRAQGEPVGFAGTLRDYQREALGWFAFLERFGFGGCLADDMGLGKTVQVLAWLAARHDARGNRGGGHRPTLVVAPRSVVFNWKAEAARFVPALRVLDHRGVGRHRDAGTIGAHDLVLTTYGTLRRDLVLLRGVAFDYVVLDEAQAIKNAKSESAKAARLLRADHRLALSGTPIENHLGELWSLFEFLNPGVLGTAAVFCKLTGTTEPDPSTRELLARALRPFVLRRTKRQVAPELPERTEQTLYCELEERQRKLYDETRDHYRRSLAETIAEQGMAKSKLHVLEALLRLRQMACHPALVAERLKHEPSAKLEMLLPHLEEIVVEDHKALVFSQFTKLLAIVRQHLDARGIAYAYLDGATRDRRAVVERFQTDPDCRLFLISLKAGGVGLNLTAAEYVFLLDPWWNPAVEAQAIDRTHRIGQTRHVMAYRLVARDTVEEKILGLQATKRELSDAILRADEGPLTGLTRDDLELLLS